MDRNQVAGYASAVIWQLLHKGPAEPAPRILLRGCARHSPHFSQPAALIPRGCQCRSQCIQIRGWDYEAIMLVNNQSEAPQQVVVNAGVPDASASRIT